jgi:hypothetical protein
MLAGVVGAVKSKSDAGDAAHKPDEDGLLGGEIFRDSLLIMFFYLNR